MPTTDANARERAYGQLRPIEDAPAPSDVAVRGPGPGKREINRLAALARLESAERTADYQAAAYRTIRTTWPLTSARQSARMAEADAYADAAQAYQRARWAWSEAWRREIEDLYS